MDSAIEHMDTKIKQQILMIRSLLTPSSLVFIGTQNEIITKNKADFIKIEYWPN